MSLSAGQSRRLPKARALSFINRIIDFFWWNRGDRDEERAWQKSGSYPDVVQRAYHKQRDFDRDAARLQSMGYRIVGVENRSVVGGGVIPETATAARQLISIKYERQANRTMAPGAELANESSTPPDES